MMTGGGASLALARLAIMRDLASSEYGAERLVGLDLKLFLEDFEFAPSGHCLRLYKSEYEAALSIGWEDDQDGMTLHDVESSGGREAVVFGQRAGVP